MIDKYIKYTLHHDTINHRYFDIAKSWMMSGRSAYKAIKIKHIFRNKQRNKI
uniref:Uncharacterized protein n=1 Tax=Arion vulgaris TaxID=1028688 RepID=A0A0B6Z2A6_9EUPU